MRRCNNGHSEGKNLQGEKAFAPQRGIVKCPRCGKMKLSHRVCKHCGYYDGQQVITIEEKQANN